MIHLLACNTRDCPWYRRGSKCRHPLAVSEEAAQHSKETVPFSCPVIKDAQILIAGTFPDDLERCEKNAIKQLRDSRGLRQQVKKARKERGLE